MEVGLGSLQHLHSGGHTTGGERIGIGDEETEADLGPHRRDSREGRCGWGFFFQQKERSIGQANLQMSPSTGGRIDQVIQLHRPEGRRITIQRLTGIRHAEDRSQRG